MADSPSLRLVDEFEAMPWEQIEGETDMAFAAFVEYRNIQAAERTVRKAGENIGKSAGSVLRWSSQFQWQARALAWDAEQDRLSREWFMAERKVMARRQAQTAQAAQGKIAQWLIELDPRKLSATEAARWYEVAVRVERQALGEPDRLQVTSGNDLNVDAMSAEEVVARLSEVQAEIREALGESNAV